MLHGTTNEVRDCYHVLLGQRIGNVIVVSEEVRDVGPDIKRIFHTTSLFWAGIYTELGLVDACQLLLVFEVTHNETS